MSRRASVEIGIFPHARLCPLSYGATNSALTLPIPARANFSFPSLESNSKSHLCRRNVKFIQHPRHWSAPAYTRCQSAISSTSYRDNDFHLGILAFVIPPSPSQDHDRRSRPVTLSWDVQEELMTRGKQVVSKMHLHASQLMELYGEQYVLVETDHEHGINIRFRMLPRRQLKAGGC